MKAPQIADILADEQAELARKAEQEAADRVARAEAKVAEEAKHEAKRRAERIERYGVDLDPAASSAIKYRGRDLPTWQRLSNEVSDRHRRVLAEAVELRQLRKWISETERKHAAQKGGDVHPGARARLEVAMASIPARQHALEVAALEVNAMVAEAQRERVAFEAAEREAKQRRDAEAVAAAKTKHEARVAEDTARRERVQAAVERGLAGKPTGGLAAVKSFVGRTLGETRHEAQGDAL